MEKCKGQTNPEKSTTETLTNECDILTALDETVKCVGTVKYEDYGAVGDGVTDDSEAIRAAHKVANDLGLPVEAKAGATYYIGSLEQTIIVKTSTNLNGATLLFDDHQVRWDDAKLRNVYVFTVAPDAEPYSVQIPEGLTLEKGQTNVGITFDKPCMIKLENSAERIYMRYGENANGGVVQNEMILVDKQGNVDPSTPIQYNYSAVTKITVYSIDDKPVTFGNGTVVTLAPNPKAYDPDYENNYCYYGRGIAVMRSNTTLSNIKHIVEGEDMTIEIDRNGDGIIDKWGADKSYGVPYIGFFYFRSCSGAVMRDCLVEGHQAYCFFQGATRNDPGTIRNEMGSYDINATDCINISFLNLTQYENKETGEVITNRFMYHGIMGSNFCRNVVMDGCYLDRFDSHQGLHNARITNSTLGFGILVIGGGDLYIENVYRIACGTFVHLRGDYNSVFNGDVVIKNCRVASGVNCMMNGVWRSFYNGLDNYMGRTLTVDGLVVEGNSEIYLYNIHGANKEAVNDAVNKLYLPEYVRFCGVEGADVPSVNVLTSYNANDAFSTVKVL
ncbi:MAG: hypothetical protein IKC61_00740 [Clostridia bacterium]|nr:hypothetical protein [Clostridia bacterium]